MPPLAPLTVAVSVLPAHTVASTGDLVKSLATGSSTTIQLILFTGDVLQSVPVAVRRLSIRLVPVTAAKLGIVVLHTLQEVPLSVEYRYSSVIVPVPPLAPLTVAVRGLPAHTVASAGDLVKSLATGSSTTIQLILFTGDVLQSVPVAVRRLSIRLVPVTAAKLGIVVLHPLQETPLSVEYRYSSVIVPVPPLAPLTVAVRVLPAHTVASAGDLVKSLATGSSTTIQLILFTGDVLQSVPVAVRRLSIRLVPVTAAKLGIVVLHPLQETPLSVEYWYSSVIVPVPPLAPLTVAVRVLPAHTVASIGDLVKSLATGSSTTIQLILFTGEVLQSVPVAVRRLSIRLVPVTAAKLGIVVLHPLQETPLSVEYWYSSVIVPVPPLAPLTVAVRVLPAHTVASIGDLVKSLATGSSTTIQLMLFTGEVLQSVPVAVRRLSIRLVPVTAAKLGIVVLHPLQETPLSVEYWYSSVIVPVPPLAPLTVAVRVLPAHTVASIGDLVKSLATGSSTTIQLMLFTGEVLQSMPVAVRRLSIRLVPVTAAKLGIVVLHPLQETPLSVEYWYSSVIVPVPPLAPLTVAVSVLPATYRGVYRGFG